MPVDLFGGSGALSADWTVDQGSFNQSAGAAFANAAGASSVARYVTETPGDDHEAYVIGQPLGTGHFIGVCVRKAVGAAFTCANFDWGTDGLYVSTWAAGVQTQVSGSPFTAPAAGTKVTLRAVGADLYLLYNDVVQQTWTSLAGLPASGTWGMTGYSNGSGTGASEWGGTDLSATGPSISGVSNASPANGSSLTITGSAFGASQGSGSVTIGGVAQTVTSWSDTSITVTVARGTNKYGTALNVVVTDDAAASSSPFALTGLQPQSGWSYVNVGTPNADTTVRLTVVSGVELASGDQVAYDNVGGTVEVFSDLTTVVYGDTLSFQAEAWTPSDGWGSTGLQTLVAPQTLEPVSTVSAGSWVSSSGGSLHAALSETSPEDGSYVYTETPGDYLEVAVDVGVDPATGYGHVPGYRIAGNGLSSMRVELRQGSTVIATFLHAPAPSEWETFFQVLTPTQADSITDYTALRLRFTEY